MKARSATRHAWQRRFGSSAAAAARETMAVRDLLGDRGSVWPDSGAGGGPRLSDGVTVPAYTTGALAPDVWIQVRPAGHGPFWPGAATAVGIIGVLLMAWWASKQTGPDSGGGNTRLERPKHGQGGARAPDGGRRPGYPRGAAAFAALFLVLLAGLAMAWGEARTSQLSTRRIDQAARAAEAALAAGAEGTTAARVAGLPWAYAEDLSRADEIWTMPQEVARALPSGSLRYRVGLHGATYYGARAGPVHLVALGYEDSGTPLVPLAATTVGGALLTALILFLVPLAARPRVLRRTLAAWGFVAPAGVLLALFTFGPLLFSLWLSLHQWHLADVVHPVIGLANYRNLLTDGAWWAAIGNTVLFALHVPVAMAAALGLALLTRGSRRAVRWARLALFLPCITSVVAIAVVWKWLLNDSHGLLNRLLAVVGLGPVSWLTSPGTALVSLMVIGIWMVAGYQMVVFHAGLAAIPRDWYDAAKVDGAGPLQRFRHITLPGFGTLFSSFW